MTNSDPTLQPPAIASITAESHPDIWALLQPPEPAQYAVFVNGQQVTRAMDYSAATDMAIAINGDNPATLPECEVSLARYASVEPETPGYMQEISPSVPAGEVPA